jgi:hypothetical protein
MASSPQQGSESARDPAIRVRLELEPGTDPLVGTCAVGDSDPVGFVGMLELLAMIDSIRVDREGDGLNRPKS